MSANINTTQQQLYKSKEDQVSFSFLPVILNWFASPSKWRSKIREVKMEKNILFCIFYNSEINEMKVCACGSFWLNWLSTSDDENPSPSHNHASLVTVISNEGDDETRLAESDIHTHNTTQHNTTHISTTTISVLTKINKNNKTTETFHSFLVVFCVSTGDTQFLMSTFLLFGVVGKIRANLFHSLLSVSPLDERVRPNPSPSYLILHFLEKTQQQQQQQLILLTRVPKSHTRFCCCCWCCCWDAHCLLFFSIIFYKY